MKNLKQKRLLIAALAILGLTGLQAVPQDTSRKNSFTHADYVAIGYSSNSDIPLSSDPVLYSQDEGYSDSGEDHSDSVRQWKEFLNNNPDTVLSTVNGFHLFSNSEQEELRNHQSHLLDSIVEKAHNEKNAQKEEEDFANAMRQWKEFIKANPEIPVKNIEGFYLFSKSEQEELKNYQNHISNDHDGMSKSEYESIVNQWMGYIDENPDAELDMTAGFDAFNNYEQEELLDYQETLRLANDLKGRIAAHHGSNDDFVDIAAEDAEGYQENRPAFWNKVKEDAKKEGKGFAEEVYMDIKEDAKDTAKEAFKIGFKKFLEKINGKKYSPQKAGQSQVTHKELTPEMSPEERKALRKERMAQANNMISK